MRLNYAKVSKKMQKLRESPIQVDERKWNARTATCPKCGVLLRPPKNQPQTPVQPQVQTKTIIQQQPIKTI